MRRLREMIATAQTAMDGATTSEARLNLVADLAYAALQDVCEHGLTIGLTIRGNPTPFALTVAIAQPADLPKQPN
jgi:hypothetical protein